MHASMWTNDYQSHPGSNGRGIEVVKEMTMGKKMQADTAGHERDDEAHRRGRINTLQKQFKKDPDPLNLLEDLAFARAMIADFAEHYAENRGALLA
jgi:hypothetical protein